MSTEETKELGIVNDEVKNEENQFTIGEGIGNDNQPPVHNPFADQDPIVMGDSTTMGETALESTDATQNEEYTESTGAIQNGEEYAETSALEPVSEPVLEGQAIDAPRMRIGMSPKLFTRARKGYAGVSTLSPTNQPPPPFDSHVNVIGMSKSSSLSSSNKGYTGVSESIDSRIEIYSEDDMYFDPHDDSLDEDADLEGPRRSARHIRGPFFFRSGAERLRRMFPTLLHHRNTTSGFITIVIVFCIGVVIIVGIHEEEVAFARNKENPIMSCNYTTLQDVLLNEMNFNALDMSKSFIQSQQKAFIWLSNVDDRFPLEYCDSYDVIQKFVIAIFYYSMDGLRWPLQLGFMNEEADLCSWNTVENGTIVGLLCENEENDNVVTSIRLLNNELKGTMPTELGKLVHLRELNLDGNEIEGNLPSELAKLENLKTLMLAKNMIGGRIPNKIMNMTQMEYLVLMDNFLTGSIPTKIGWLTNLVELRLDGNLLDGTIPTEIGMLPNIITACFFYNQLEGNIPSEVENMVSLRYFEIDFNRLTGTIPTEMGNLQNLLHMDLFENQFSGTLPTELGKLENLEFMELHSNALKGTLPTEYGQLTSLERLELYKNKLSGTIPQTYLKLRNLADVDITWGNNITGDFNMLCGVKDLTIWFYCGVESYSDESCDCCMCWEYD